MGVSSVGSGRVIDLPVGFDAKGASDSSNAEATRRPRDEGAEAKQRPRDDAVDTSRLSRTAESAVFNASYAYKMSAREALKGDTEMLDAFSIALTGMSYSELSQDSGQLKIFTNLLKGVASGDSTNVPYTKIAVSGDPSEPGGTHILPPGVDAAFVPWDDLADPGTVLFSADLDRDEFSAIALKMFGTRIANRAESMGLELAPGDVGARLATAIFGEEPATGADPFDAESEVSFSVVLNGRLETATASVGTPPAAEQDDDGLFKRTVEQ